MARVWASNFKTRKTPLLLIPPKFYTPDRHFFVTVKLLKPNEMRRKYGEYYDGMFDAPNRHIDLNRRMPLSRKWWVFAQIWKQVINEYWLPWMLEAGIAMEDPPDPRRTRAHIQKLQAYERSRWPRRKVQRLKAGRMPDQTSDSDGLEALTQGSSPIEDSAGSI